MLQCIASNKMKLWLLRDLLNASHNYFGWYKVFFIIISPFNIGYCHCMTLLIKCKASCSKSRPQKYNNKKSVGVILGPFAA